MLEKLSSSSGPVVGYKVVGKVTADDYKQLVPDVQALTDKYDQVGVLIDLQEFAGEDVGAWLSDLKFGHKFHDKIAKMAIVGDKGWERWLAALADPFYAKDAQYFHSADLEKAWAWLVADD
ncbi:MAG: STAS/SEC14 domain-containing protein [Candidatus Promineifilaceae bacterium]